MTGHSVALLPVVFSLACRLTAADLPGSGTTPEALAAKHLAAAGGKDRLAAITSQVLKGDAQEGEGAFSAEISFKDDKLLLHATAPNGFAIKQGHDGQGHWWRQDPQGVREFTGPKEQLEFREMTLALSARALLDLAKYFPDLELRPAEKLGSNDCQVLEARIPTGVPLKLWFNTKSGLLAKVGTTLLEDYRPEDGILVPHRILNSTGLLLKIKSVAFNVPVPDARFAMPSGASPAGEIKAEGDLYSTKLNSGTQLGFVRQPAPANFSKGPLLSIPVYKPESQQRSKWIYGVLMFRASLWTSG